MFFLSVQKRMVRVEKRKRKTFRLKKQKVGAVTEIIGRSFISILSFIAKQQRYLAVSAAQMQNIIQLAAVKAAEGAVKIDSRIAPQESQIVDALIKSVSGSLPTAGEGAAAIVLSGFIGYMIKNPDVVKNIAYSLGKILGSRTIPGVATPETAKMLIGMPRARSLPPDVVEILQKGLLDYQGKIGDVRIPKGYTNNISAIKCIQLLGEGQLRTPSIRSNSFREDLTELCGPAPVGTHADHQFMLEEIIRAIMRQDINISTTLMDMIRLVVNVALTNGRFLSISANQGLSQLLRRVPLPTQLEIKNFIKAEYEKNIIAVYTCYDNKWVGVLDADQAFEIIMRTRIAFATNFSNNIEAFMGYFGVTFDQNSRLVISRIMSNLQFIAEVIPFQRGGGGLEKEMQQTLIELITKLIKIFTVNINFTYNSYFNGTYTNKNPIPSVYQQLEDSKFTVFLINLVKKLESDSVEDLDPDIFYLETKLNSFSKPTHVGLFNRRPVQGTGMNYIPMVGFVPSAKKMGGTFKSYRKKGNTIQE